MIFITDETDYDDNKMILVVIKNILKRPLHDIQSFYYIVN